MRARAAKLAVLCLLALGLGAAPAQAEFGLNNFDVAFTNEDGTLATQAGSHPFAMTTSFGVNFIEDEVELRSVTEGRIKDFFLEQMPGLVADTTAFPRCAAVQFLQDADCPAATQLGITASATNLGWRASPVYNLAPPPGSLLRLGWNVAGEANIVIDVNVNSEDPHNGIATSRNISQVVYVFANVTQIWGVPTDSAHDHLRDECLESEYPEVTIGDLEGFEFESTGGSCPIDPGPDPKPFLTLPTNCGGAMSSSYEAFSWEGAFDSGGVVNRDAAGNPRPFTGCGKLGFNPSFGAEPTSRGASSPTGLDVSLQVKDEGLTSIGGLAHSQIRDVEVTLPEGMRANPSLAEGLEVCSEGDLRRETLRSGPGDGCPEASKIGTIEVESPLASEAVSGSLYQAEPFDNLADDALLAFYIVLKNPKLGILVKQVTRVEPDPRTGRLRALAEDIPQLPFSSFRLRFREGGRSPLISPPLCGEYEATAKMDPWSGGAPFVSTSTFEILAGPNGGPCPAGGTPPFAPGFAAGSLNPAAGQHSPFLMQLTRRDGDQDLTKFSAVLPPGVTARLAGLAWCPEAAIARAASRQGRAELSSPSCPAASGIGRVSAGAGVGSQLTYVDGGLYLAGPYKGAPLSVVAVVPAVAGPFDIGTVVTRVGLRLNPKTGRGEVDGAASDPIPHILAGIPLAVREIRVLADRPAFTLNPTSCRESQTLATIWGSGSHVFSPLDDVPFGAASRFQAASCASLAFKPRLAIKLRGGVKRGAHPALRAVVTPPPGQANFARAAATLPRSAFLEQAHIRTICTRVQFAAGPGHGALCPKAARYGFARAWSPLLDAPAQGPVYLRSSSNKLPDLVVALKGPPSAPVEVELSARIDSVRGGIRSIFNGIPDLPVSRFILDMQGGRKGLIVNSRHLCRKPGRNRAKANLLGQNSRRHTAKPVVRARCKGKRGARRGRTGR